MSDEQQKQDPGTEIQLTKEQQQAAEYKQRRNNLSGMLKTMTPNLQEALPKLLTPERMIRTALTAMSKTPKLMQCTDVSIIASLMTCAQLGLLPDATIGEAYLIPFDNTRKQITECTVIVGYKGLCTLAMRSGQVKSIQARSVYKGDEFSYKFGLQEDLSHVPKGDIDPKNITHFYCVVRFNNGGHVFDVMTREQVEAIRDGSANYKFAQDKANTIWGKHFSEMGNKTVLRRLMKFVPLSAELQRAIGLDEEAEVGKQNTAADFMDMGFGDQYTDVVVVETLRDEKIDGAEKKADSAEAKKKKAADAAQNTLDLINDGKGKTA